MSLFYHIKSLSVIISCLSMKDRVTIITGASRGVGRATAHLFAQAGAQVVLFSRPPAKLDEVAGEITDAGGYALAIAGDVSRGEDVHFLFQKVLETYGGIDVLVNCAGIVAVRPFVEMDVATWDSVLGVNLRGTFLCCRAAFQIMAKQQQGIIINMSSLSGVKGVEKFPGLSAYNVSKAGVAGLTEILLFLADDSGRMLSGSNIEIFSNL